MSNGLAKMARNVQRENLELHRAQCGADSRHTIRTSRTLEFWEGYVSQINNILDNRMTRNQRRGLLNQIIQSFKDSFFHSTCHMLPCGQTSHAELITRLGIEERYPQGVLVTPEDIGVPELGIEVGDLFRAV